MTLILKAVCRRNRARQVGCAAAFGLALAACGGSPSPAGGSSGSGARIPVVAAENAWGSIAAQIGGDHVQVTSLITSPDTDPHTYEPSPQDARTVATAQYVIVNGAGYDPWADKLLNANPASSRTTLKVGELAGRKDGDNPHMWYSPAIVGSFIDRVTSDLTSKDPGDAAYFDQQRARYESAGLGRYNQLIGDIKSRFSATPVGATESIVVDLADALGLDLITPPAYMKAISEGTDPPAADKATFDAQIGQRQIKVLIFNKQNSSPDIRALVTKAKDGGIPVATVTETLDPAGTSFQGWQSEQLQAIENALSRAQGGGTASPAASPSSRP